MPYLQSHWRGKQPLRIALWVNLIGLLIVVSYLELFILSRLASNPESLIKLTLGSLLVTRLIIFPWQIIGFFRALDHDFIEHKNFLKTRVLQGFAMMTILFTMVYALEVIQGSLYYQKQVETYSRPSTPVKYQLILSTDQTYLKLNGDLEIGITRAVRLMIEANPQIKSVILQSKGGQIYEGRGLAKIFTEYELDSYVFNECSSACVTAFIGGKQRYLGPKGKLGFHQYRIETSIYRKVVPFYDLRIEQQRDLALFKSRGIDAAFLERMFDQPANRIWFPDHATLIKSRVIDAIKTPIDSSSSNDN